MTPRGRLALLASGALALSGVVLTDPALPGPISAGATPAGAPASVDLARIVEGAKKAQVADTAAWTRYSFRRQALRQDLNDDGSVYESEEHDFLVTPGAEGFDERLLRLDGREPTSHEVASHRRQAKFTKHYKTMLAGEGDDEEGGYSLGQLLSLSSYRYQGQETIEGVPCHRLDFSPDEAKSPGGLAGRFIEAMAGSLWLTVDGLHLKRATVRTVRPVSIALSLSKVHELRVLLESQPVGGGVWLPRRIEVLTSMRVLMSAIRRRNVYSYSEFHLVGAAGSAG